MSERYGQCRQCKGKGFISIKQIVKSGPETPDFFEMECMACTGTGISGNAIDYIQMQYDADWEKDKPSSYYAPIGEI